MPYPRRRVIHALLRNKLPVAILAGLAAFVVTYRLVGLPASDGLLTTAKSLYATHGYLVVFVGALLEALFVLGLYVPGSTVVALGAALSRSIGLSLAVVVLVASVGFLTAYLLDYLIGWLGWHVLLSRAVPTSAMLHIRKRLARRGLPALLVLCFHPSTAAMAAATCGVLRYPTARFVLVMTVGTVAWTTAWGMVAYSLGDLVVDLLNLQWLLLVVAIWVTILVVRSLFNADDPGI